MPRACLCAAGTYLFCLLLGSCARIHMTHLQDLLPGEQPKGCCRTLTPCGFTHKDQSPTPAFALPGTYHLQAVSHSFQHHSSLQYCDRMFVWHRGDESALPLALGKNSAETELLAEGDAGDAEAPGDPTPAQPHPVLHPLHPSSHLLLLHGEGENANPTFNPTCRLRPPPSRLREPCTRPGGLHALHYGWSGAPEPPAAPPEPRGRSATSPMSKSQPNSIPLPPRLLRSKVGRHDPEGSVTH